MNLAQRLKSNPAAVWGGIALVACALLALPFVLAMAGTTWVRVTNLAILFTLLALGLNIVVGFAGLLDLGYIAFYGVGAYVYALLASPQFNLHLPFWIILPIGALAACVFGVLLGAPTLKLRGEHVRIRKEKGKPVGREHINGIEGFWSYAKNWLYPFRGVPRKHFHLYLGEICFRFNHRSEDLYPLLYKLLRTTNFNDLDPKLVRNR